MRSNQILYKMAMKLYKLDGSPPARAAMMTAELLKVPLQSLDLDLLQGAHLEPDYLKKNPLHTIPVLEDGNLIIHDSHAIVIYLAETYGKDDTLYPKDPRKRALVNQKMFFDTGYLFPRMRAVTYATIFEGLKKPTEKHVKDIDEAYGFIEAFLSNTKWIASDHMTIADISAVASVSSLLLLHPLDAKKYPKTQAWLTGFESLPFYKTKNIPGLNTLRVMINQKWSS